MAEKRLPLEVVPSSFTTTWISAVGGLGLGLVLPLPFVLVPPLLSPVLPSSSLLQDTINGKATTKIISKFQILLFFITF